MTPPDSPRPVVSRTQRSLEALVDYIVEQGKPPKTVLDTAELAEYLGVSATEVKNWRRSGKGPRALRLAGSRVIKYRLADVDRWLESQDEVSPVRRRRRRQAG